MARPKENVIITRTGALEGQKAKYKINKKTGKIATGRPRIIDEEMTKKLEEQFSRNSSIRTACAIAGVSEKVYYEECQRNPEFSDRMKKAQELVPSLADRVIAKSIRDGDTNTAKRMKERTDERYKRDTKIGVQTETDPESGNVKTGLMVTFEEV